MILDGRGAVIESVTNIQQPMIGPDYIVVWDTQGMPIHIKRSVLDYLFASVYGDTSNKTIIPVPPTSVDPNEVFL